MNDLISRQAAIDAFLTELTKRERKNLLHTWSTVEVKYFVVDMLEKLPSAQPERKTGRWIERWHENKHVIGDMACSVCGAQMLLTYPRFCPYCGAEMRGEQDE